MTDTMTTLTKREAEDLTSQICEAVTDAHTLILRALEGRADKTLGYASWQEYVNDRFPVSVRQVASSARREMVAELRSEGKSLRAIASVLGVGDTTVRRDLAGAPDGAGADRVMGLDGKEYPSTRIGSEELDAITATLEDEFGAGNVTVETLATAVAENLESKRVPAISKPDLGGGVSHPARFSDPLLPIFADMLAPGMRVLDPFAGTGKIHLLRDLIDVETIGIELEPEWADLHDDTHEGNALDLPFGDGEFDAIVTSPTYGNRLADHHNASDPELRRSYTHDLGRDLSPGNSGQMHWGDEYRDFHLRAWKEADRVLKAGGRFVLNIKDHIRGGERKYVTDWHIGALRDLGLRFVGAVPVPTANLRQGTNSEARAGLELVLAFDK